MNDCCLMDMLVDSFLTKKNAVVNYALWIQVGGHLQMTRYTYHSVPKTKLFRNNVWNDLEVPCLDIVYCAEWDSIIPQKYYYIKYLLTVLKGILGITCTRVVVNTRLKTIVKKLM